MPDSPAFRHLHTHPASSHCTGLGHTLHVNTASGGKGYPARPYYTGGGKGNILHVLTAGDRKEYTLHVQTADVVMVQGIPTARLN